MLWVGFKFVGVDMADFNSSWVDDPSYVAPNGRRAPSTRQFSSPSFDEQDDTIDDAPDLAQLLKSQARLAASLQRRVETSPTLEIKELKDIATACSTLVNGVHRTGEIHRELETYRLFHSIVLEFLKTRSDALGEDLLSELRTVATQMSARSQVADLLR